MSEDDSLSTFSGSDEEGTDSRAKKKVQNSVRWKRWWLKNRDKYNEKRRLSAQLRSAKNKAERAKASAMKESLPSRSKRQKRSTPDKVELSRENSITGSPKSIPAEDTPVVSTANIPPSISPSLSHMTTGGSGTSSQMVPTAAFNAAMMGQVQGVQLAWQQPPQRVYAFHPSQMNYVYHMQHAQQQHIAQAGMAFVPAQFLNQQSAFINSNPQIMQQKHATFLNQGMMGHQ